MREGRPHPFVELTRVRVRELLREPEALFWVFAFPVLMACALGVAFRSQAPQPIPIGVQSGAGSADVIRLLGADPQLAVREVPHGEVDRVLRNGAVHLVVVPGDVPSYRFDSTRPETRLARLAADQALQRGRGRTDAFVPADDTAVPQGSRYIDWVLPGLLGLNIMGSGMWGIGFSIVQARTRKLLKRLVATPMRRSDYLLSHLASRLIFLVLEVGALVGFGMLVFGTPLNGSLAGFSAICLLGAGSFGGLGLLVASRAKTVEAVSGWMNVVMLPMWLLSGVFFASDNFPAAMQPFIQALPLTALNDALRGNMIDGVALFALWPELLVLLAWGVIPFAVALRIFRWR
jgi:ABC-type polysaccharide/polyol phosphate export permease